MKIGVRPMCVRLSGRSLSYLYWWVRQRYYVLLVNLMNAEKTSNPFPIHVAAFSEFYNRISIL